MAQTLDDGRMERARARFFAGYDLPEGLVPEPILKSWQRCVAQGLDVGDFGSIEPLTATELRERQQRNDLLRHLVRPEISVLRAEAKSTDSVVIITDAQGAVLDSVGSVEFAGQASAVALRPGVMWSEASTGTNAIGTALVERRPISVHGAEHYFEPHRMLACAAAPIFDPQLRLAGVLDMSGHASVQHIHALGLVRLAAEQVEHRFFARGFEDCEIIRFQKEADLLGTPREAILVFRDGVLVAGNRRAMKLMTLDRRALGTALRDELLLGDEGQMRLGHVVTTGGERFAVTPPPSRPVRVAGIDLGDAPKAYFTTETQANLRKAVKLADAGIPLLIQGETGVGKEVFAREMHRHTTRSGKPFVAINCAALPESLIEAELFGYADGAFTGARKQGRMGLVQQADGGVLFLDEIGDMPLSLQSRMLRVLQDREVMPLGGGKPTKVDFLPVAATHRPLRELVEEGRFRADLYYRLAHYVVELPPLRSLPGRSDILKAIWRQAGGAREGVTLSAAAEERLLAYSWPGNFRQLAGAVRAMLALAEPGSVLTPEDLPHELAATPQPRVATELLAASSGAADLATLTDEAIRQAIATADGNLSKAARMLGIDRSTLYRRSIRKASSARRH